MSATGALIRLDRSWIGPASDVLARAFWEYPMVRYVWPDEGERRRRIRHLFDYVLRYGIRYGEAYGSSPNLEAVAVWVPSDNWPMTFRRLLRSGALWSGLRIGMKTGRRMQPLGQHIDDTHERLAPFRHWYLWNLGVAPESRRQGHSSRLVRPILARIRKEGLPCYVDTMDERNVAIYEHLGFELLEKSAVPGTDLYDWAFLSER